MLDSNAAHHGRNALAALLGPGRSRTLRRARLRRSLSRVEETVHHDRGMLARRVEAVPHDEWRSPEPQPPERGSAFRARDDSAGERERPKQLGELGDVRLETIDSSLVVVIGEVQELVAEIRAERRVVCDAWRPQLGVFEDRVLCRSSWTARARTRASSNVCRISAHVTVRPSPRSYRCQVS